MRVVVTGASGNVGTSVLDVLADADPVEDVVAIARRLPTARDERARWRSADVARDDLAALFAGADVVIHLAWLIQPSRDERLTHRVNVEGSARVFDATAKAAVPALVYASSVGTYAPAASSAPVDESWPTTGIPTSFYSRQKAAVERLLDDFEVRHPDIRTVRLRPALTFKQEAATEIRRLFIGPLLPGRVLRRDWLPLLPFPRGLRTQAVDSHDVGRAYRLAALGDVRGAFNVAAPPVLDASLLAAALGGRSVELPAGAIRAAAWATWKARLQPTSPGWLDMGMLSPIMDTARAQRELGWNATVRADEAVVALLDGLRRGTGASTPPLDPRSSGTLRWREFRSGVGARDISPFRGGRPGQPRKPLDERPKQASTNCLAPEHTTLRARVPPDDKEGS